MPEVIKSKKFLIALIILGLVLIVLFSFSLGVAVGIKKVKFSDRFGENYERNFMGPHPGNNFSGGRDFSDRERGPGGPMGMMREKFEDLEGGDFRNAHGIVGTILSLTENNLVIKDREDRENTIAVSEETIIKSKREKIKISDLKNQDEIVVMGEPGEDGTIQASFIRILNRKATE